MIQNFTLVSTSAGISAPNFPRALLSSLPWEIVRSIEREQPHPTVKPAQGAT